MLKKILLILLLPVILLTSCKDEQDNNDILKLNLSDVVTVEIHKDVAISSNEITSAYLTYTNDLEPLSKLEYNKDTKFTGPSTYNYLIKLDENNQLFVIDNTTFVYNNYKCNLVNSNFEFLNTLPYYQEEELISLNLDAKIKEFKITKSTNEIFYLNKTEKMTIFTNKMNNLLLVTTNEVVEENLTYEITYGDTTIKVINHQYITLNNLTYKILKGNTIFLDQYTQNNTDSESQSSGWLPWI